MRFRRPLLLGLGLILAGVKAATLALACLLLAGCGSFEGASPTTTAAPVRSPRCLDVSEPLLHYVWDPEWTGALPLAHAQAVKMKGQERVYFVSAYVLDELPQPGLDPIATWWTYTLEPTIDENVWTVNETAQAISYWGFAGNAGSVADGAEPEPVLTMESDGALQSQACVEAARASE